MASLVLGVAGGVAGFMVGGPAGAQIGFALGSAAGGMLFPPKGPDGPRLNDLTVQSSTYGKPIPIPYGSFRIASNIIWADKIQEHAHDEGGKGGPSYTTYSYTCSFASSICEGPIAGVTRIWADGLLIYDKRPTNTGKQLGFKAGSYKLYLGDEEQLPDPTIQAIQGDTPAYRGQAYMVFTDLQLEKFGNRIPSLSFEVVHHADTTVKAPVQFGLGVHMAVDPVTGYIWSTNPDFGGGIKIYDPKTLALVATVPLPVYGLVYSEQYGAMVGGISNNGGGQLGYLINTSNYTYSPIESPNDTELGGYAFFQPNIPSRELVFFGSGGLAGGSGWSYEYGQVDAVVPGNAYDVQVSPDRRTQVFTSNFNPFLGIDLAISSSGRYDFRLKVSNAAWPTGSGGQTIAFNDPDYVLYWGFNGGEGVYQVDLVSGALALVLPGVTANMLLYSPDTQLLYVQDQWYGSFASYSMGSDGQFHKVEDFPGTGLGSTGGQIASVYLGNDQWIGLARTELFQLSFGSTISAAPVQLKDIVRDISLRCDLTDGDIDVSELTDMVDGYCITHQMAGRSAIEPLMQAYFFDPVESDYQIKFRKRGRPSVATIQDDDLAAHSAGSEVPDLIQIKRKQEVDLPQQVNVKYINPDADYQTSTQYECRLTGRSSSAVTVDLPIVLSDDKAKAVAAASLYSAWAERTGLTFSTSLKYAAIEPTDMAVVHNRLVRIVHRKRNGGILEWEAYADGNTIYPSDTTMQGGTSAPAGAVSQTITATPTAQLVALDAPIAQVGTTGPVITFAVQGRATGFTGAQIWKSIDGGKSYAPIANAPTASLIGTATTALGNWVGGDTFDETSTVTVKLLPSSSGATLSSATEEAVLNGANAVMLGGEVLQYKRATLNDDGSYTLSGLLRYRRGTDYATHAAGEWFVPLTSSLVQIPVSTSEIGLPRQYKAVANGTSLADATAVTLTYTGNDLKPYSPVQIGGWRDDAGDLTLTWVRRTRIGGEWRDGVEVPLGESSEAYDVEILGSGGAVVHTFSGVTAPSIEYSAAQQVADFGALPSSVTARIYELSSIVGRGWPGTGTV